MPRLRQPPTKSQNPLLEEEGDGDPLSSAGVYIYFVYILHINFRKRAS